MIGNLSLVECFQMTQMFRKSNNRASGFHWAQTVMLILFTVGVTGSIAVGSGDKRSEVAAHPSRTKSPGVTTAERFSCLPKDVTADQVVSYGLKGRQKVTVERKLTELKARCRSGKLVDARGREI